MQTFDEVCGLIGGVAPGPTGFAVAMARLLQGQGDDAVVDQTADDVRIRQSSWRLMDERGSLHPAAFDAWNELWVGAGLAHDRFMRLDVTQRRDRGDPVWEWRLRRVHG
jgi:hypothetical protein